MARRRFARKYEGENKQRMSVLARRMLYLGIATSILFLFVTVGMMYG